MAITITPTGKWHTDEHEHEHEHVGETRTRDEDPRSARGALDTLWGMPLGTSRIDRCGARSNQTVEIKPEPRMHLLAAGDHQLNLFWADIGELEEHVVRQHVLGALVLLAGYLVPPGMQRLKWGSHGAVGRGIRGGRTSQHTAAPRTPQPALRTRTHHTPMRIALQIAQRAVMGWRCRSDGVAASHTKPALVGEKKPSQATPGVV